MAVGEAFEPYCIFFSRPAKSDFEFRDGEFPMG